MEDLTSVINKPTNELYVDTIVTKIGCAIIMQYKVIERVEEWADTWNPNNCYNGLDEWIDSTIKGQALDWNREQTSSSGKQWSENDKTFSSGGQWSGNDKTSSFGGQWSGNQKTFSSGGHWSGNDKTSSSGGQWSGNDKTSSSGGHWSGNEKTEFNHGVVDIWKQNKAYNVTTTVVDWYGGQQYGFNSIQLTSLFQQMTLNLWDPVNTVELSGAKSIDNPLDWSDMQPSETNPFKKPSEVNPFKKVSSILNQTTQELQDAGINFNKEDFTNLHTMSLEKFNHLLMNNNLSQEQIEKCKEIRRRVKNNVAAHNSRKRKCSQIDQLAKELQLKESEKRACQVKNEELYNMKLEEQKRLNMLINNILTLSNRSPDHYTVKVINNEAKVVRKQ